MRSCTFGLIVVTGLMLPKLNCCILRCKTLRANLWPGTGIAAELTHELTK